MFAHLTATRTNGEQAKWKGHGELADAVLHSWKTKGYTEITDSRDAIKAPAAPVTPIVDTTAKTGRVGKGVKIHRIIAGHAKCGASFRRNRIITGATGREVTITGEAVTCTGCR